MFSLIHEVSYDTNIGSNLLLMFKIQNSSPSECFILGCLMSMTKVPKKMLHSMAC